MLASKTPPVHLRDHGWMNEDRSRSGVDFRPVTGPQEAEGVRRFLLAQGWAGLAAGYELTRLARRGVKPEEVLWLLPGRAEETRAVAFLHQDLAGLVLTSSDQGLAAQALLHDHLPLVRHIAVMEGQVDCSGFDEFDCYRREITVAPELRTPDAPLPAIRPGTSQDVDQIQAVYQHVTWMRRDTPEGWRQRIAEQPCWVAEVDGEVVAVARWTMSFGSWVEVGGVATRPDFRRHGAATAVTVAAAAAALAAGRQVALRYGDPALATLYHPLGFEHVGRELVFQRRS